MEVFKKSKIHVSIRDVIIAVLLCVLILLIWSIKYDQSNVIKINTITLHDTLKKGAINLSEYNDLYSKLLDQKQQSYDSMLNHLNYWASALGVIFTVLLGITIFVGVYEINSIKRELKEEHEKFKNDLNSHINAEVKKTAEGLIRKLYETDVSELKEQVSSIDNLAKEITDSYVLRCDKEKPILELPRRKNEETEDPFNKKD